MGEDERVKSKQAGSCSELMADKCNESESESKSEKQAGRFLLRAVADKCDENESGSESEKQAGRFLLRAYGRQI